ncbi:VanZ family protein [Anaerobranca gottschalkii]|uniref:VanZ like family protein n=1 Tax=Anaerobranca gottschalkii DSM 13577 TaxID=1120990 RepID=A0A1H9ZKS0_9FIRM|nr:VanZ family protein [Anaerobranca gottschalkii]SES82271.1 VanZ like family protein [Anaerobranca gottschalkii DSM 13577]
MTDKLKVIIAWLLVFIWMAIIFYFSSQQGEESSELSSGLVQVVVEITEKLVPNTVNRLDYNTLHHFIRKQGHFFIYFILGILTSNALTLSRVKGQKNIWLSLSVCVIYAITDEVHQVFVPGRSGEVRDVLIDSIGAFAGIVIYRNLRFLKKGF